MALLKIVRDSGWGDRFRAYRIMLDGNEIDRIRNGETKALSVSLGQHELSARIDWCGSKTAQFTIIEDNQTVAFHVESNFRGLRAFLIAWYIPSFFSNPNIYLNLERI
jgi:hypothetical protein